VQTTRVTAGRRGEESEAVPLTSECPKP